MKLPLVPVLGLAGLMVCPAGADVVVAPGGLSPTAALQVNGPLTVVNLTGPSRIDWSDFNLPSGRELRYVSPVGAAFPSLNVVKGPAPAVIGGNISADGPFYLISPGGVQVGSTGRITAPRVLLSTLRPASPSAVLADGSGIFQQDLLGGAIGVDGVVETTGGSLVVLAATVSTGGQSRLRSSGGDVRIAAVDSGPVQVGTQGGSLVAPASGGAGLVNQTGWIDARRVEIVSDGFVLNGGRLTATGQGNQIRMAAMEVIHESRSDNSSVIVTSALSIEGSFRQAGAVLNPNDGPNPAAAAGVRQTPRLSTGGFLTTVEPGQTQLSTAPLQSKTTALSAVPPPTKRSPALAARRGDSGTVRKASFFGQNVRR